MRHHCQWIRRYSFVDSRRVVFGNCIHKFHTLGTPHSLLYTYAVFTQSFLFSIMSAICRVTFDSYPNRVDTGAEYCNFGTGIPDALGTKRIWVNIIVPVSFLIALQVCIHYSIDERKIHFHSCRIVDTRTRANNSDY